MPFLKGKLLSNKCATTSANHDYLKSAENVFSGMSREQKSTSSVNEIAIALQNIQHAIDRRASEFELTGRI